MLKNLFKGILYFNVALNLAGDEKGIAGNADLITGNINYRLALEAFKIEYPKSL